MLIKVGDTVQVICGNDRGRKGKVLNVDQVANKVLVEGINVVFKHVRRSQKNPQGGGRPDPRRASEGRTVSELVWLIAAKSVIQILPERRIAMMSQRPKMPAMR